jgi:hypothetical protein
MIQAAIATSWHCIEVHCDGGLDHQARAQRPEGLQHNDREPVVSSPHGEQLVYIGVLAIEPDGEVRFFELCSRMHRVAFGRNCSVVG